MVLGVVIPIVSASVALTVAAYALRLGRMPGWCAHRWLAAIATGSALYALGNVATTTGQPDSVVLLASRFQLFGLIVELWGWFHFADGDSGSPPTWERWTRRALLGLGVLALVPGVAYGGAVASHRFVPWGASYRDAVPTPVGYLTFALGLAASVWLVGKFFLAWRRRVPSALLHGSALAILLLLAVNDALAATGLAETPYLLDVGFLIPLGAVFWSQGGRFIQEAAMLRELRERLELAVAQRTDELAVAHRELRQAERLSAMGQFAAGVAHRINNPAAVVQSTLNQLHEALANGQQPHDAIESILEAREATRRICALVRQLSEAGRMASGPAHRHGCEVGPLLEQVVAEVRSRHTAGVAFFVQPPPALRVRMGQDDLRKVIAALVSNAAQAVNRGQALNVVVKARELPGREVIVGVCDDGHGMTEEVLARAFDPFFTTRPEGQGAGLGLAVARALVEHAGGAIILESAPGAGTTAWVRLPRAEAALPES
jgi:signal transduction histidine kinase